MSHDNIRQIAGAFRSAIESTPLELRRPLMESFPVGACGVSSALLGAYFEEKDVLGFQWICGVRETSDPGRWETHAWLQRDTLVVDITADQFSDAPDRVIVDDPSEWHDVFGARTSRPADFRKWDWIEPYEGMYTYLKSTIVT